MNGLDLFSGIGGISLALKPWVRSVAYCEQDRYAQAVLMSRMQSGELDRAPIWDDIRTLRADMLPSIDIIFGGFPCQDISVAGKGAGIDGDRSGLYFQLLRLIDECQPTHVFLENVPAIRTRGLDEVAKTLADRGYDLRWKIVSASEVGAPHLRKRWWLLASNSKSDRLQRLWTGGEQESQASPTAGLFGCKGENCGYTEWEAEPNVGRVVDGLRFRVDRIKCLGNSVVPAQARKAFLELRG